MAYELDIERVSLECDFNNVDHRTDLNGTDRLIVRRGQAFSIRLYLRAGQYQPGSSSLTCVAQTGPAPAEQYGTKAVFGLSPSVDCSRWSAAVTSPPGDSLVLSLCTDPNAPIGRYTLTLGSSTKIDFILLFNPWCSGDAVHMESDKDLEEYVLAQDGLIFTGSYKYQLPIPWNFGQFESGILDVCLRILDMNPKCRRNPGKDHSGRRNPIYVCRVLSAMVNCNDEDNGVLLGNWKDDFSGGVSPMSWRGSVEILRQWNSQSCDSVKFGQCWVFAAVACTVARALGIPCRVVTNYVSAHDSNADLVIKRYVNENGEPIQRNEMIWNFHCWVESWMTRPDLKNPEFNGWQAYDPTPQEKSKGVYCCGPVPVRAIKQGELTSKYDAPFVFAEVNADVLTFMQKKDGSVSEVTYTTWVGQNISTKRVGSDDREDITHLYKYPEGSDEERETFKKAKHETKLLHEMSHGEGLQLAIKVSPDMNKGCDFDVFALVTNRGPSQKMCRLMFVSCAVSYTGVLGGNCGFKDLLNVELPPGGERKVPLRLNFSKYGSELTEDNLIRLAAVLLDYSTGEILMAVRNIILTNPEIKVRILGEPKENRKLAAEISLKNPLPEALSNCCFSIEGANLTGGVISESLGQCVEPGQEAKAKIYFTPTRCGLRKLVVNFDSSQLCHVKGYRNVIIGK